MLKITNKSIATITTLIVSIVSFFSPVQSAIYQDDRITVIVYIFFIIALTAVVSVIPKEAPEEGFLSKRIFKGIGGLSSESSIPREELKKTLVSLIQSAENDPIIVVGKSGVGKSFLVADQVIPQLTSLGYSTVYLDSYRMANDGLKVSLYNQLSNINSNINDKMFFEKADFPLIDTAGILVVFDQFEQFLFQCTSNTKENISRREWLKQLITNLAEQKNVQVVIVVRKEWYYDLRFLTDFIPSPANAFHIYGIKSDNISGTQQIASAIGQAVENDNLANVIVKDLYKDNEILPIDVQMVGLVLENEAHIHHNFDVDKYYEMGGKSGLIHKFFRTYIKSSPNRQVSLKVLYSMSVETHLRTQHTCTEIAQTVHESDREVKDCLIYFEKEGIVKKKSNGEYELAHDYLAENFHNMSATDLDPITRDNISVFYDSIKNNSNIKLTRPKNKEKPLFSDYIRIFLIVLVTARLLTPVLFPDYIVNYIQSFNPLKLIVNQSNWIDTTYFPAFISHTFWFMYVTALYKNLLYHIEGRFFSVFTVINCALCVIAATIWPNWFVVSIGWGGTIVGVRYFMLCRTPDLGQSSKNILLRIALTTIMNSVIVMAFGYIMVYFLGTINDTQELQRVWTVSGYFAAFILCYFALAVSREHVTKEAGAILMGLIDRGKLKNNTKQ